MCGAGWYSLKGSVDGELGMGWCFLGGGSSELEVMAMCNVQMWMVVLRCMRVFWLSLVFAWWDETCSNGRMWFVVGSVMTLSGGSRGGVFLDVEDVVGARSSS